MWLAPDAIATWEAVGVGTRGGQRQYSDLAIETALTLRLIFHLPLRQTEGFLTSIFGMLGLALSAPDHTTLSRRGQHLDLTLRRAPAGVGLHLIVDSTGLSIMGEGEWAAVKHGGRGRRGWKKLHLGVDRSGVIVARALTEASVDDATTGITLIEAVDGDLGRVTADAAYDTVGFYEAAGARRATVVVPPTSTANVSRHGPRSSARDRTILAVKETGRLRWKQMSGYHGQARVENAFFRYKSIIGDSLRACSPAGRGTEVVLACNMAKACEVARVARSEHYRWLRYRRYAARFREAEEHAIQALETEARRRAMVGIEKPIFYKGHAVTYVRAFSDGLLMFLLKAKRPDIYRDRGPNGSGPAEPPSPPPADARVLTRLSRDTLEQALAELTDAGSPPGDPDPDRHPR